MWKDCMRWCGAPHCRLRGVGACEETGNDHTCGQRPSRGIWVVAYFFHPVLLPFSVLYTCIVPVVLILEPHHYKRYALFFLFMGPTQTTPTLTWTYQYHPSFIYAVNHTCIARTFPFWSSWSCFLPSSPAAPCWSPPPRPRCRRTFQAPERDHLIIITMTIIIIITIILMGACLDQLLPTAGALHPLEFATWWWHWLWW